MTSRPATRVLSMVMRGMEAFDSRDLKMAQAAFSAAQDFADETDVDLLLALRSAFQAVKRDDRKGLLQAVALAAAAAQRGAAPRPGPAAAVPLVAPEPAAPQPAAPEPAVPAPPTGLPGFSEAASPAPLPPPDSHGPTAPPAPPHQPSPSPNLPLNPPAITSPTENTVSTPPPAAPPPAAPEPAAPEPAAPEPAAPEPAAPPPTAPPPAAPEPAAPPPAAPPPKSPLSPIVMRLAEGEHAMKRGDLPAALDALDHALQQCADAPENADMTAATHFSRLGLLLFKAGQWHAAKQATTPALDIKTRLLGKSNKRIAGELTLLSAACEKLGNHEEARRLAERDIVIRRLQSNGHPADLAASLANYGRASLGLEDFLSATPALQEALDIARNIGADELWQADILDLLGQTEGALRPGGTARTLHEDAFTLRRSRLPDHHPDIARSLMHASLFMLTDGALTEAERHARAALQIFESTETATDTNAARCQEILALLAVRRQELEPGRLLLVSAVERLRQACARDNPIVMKAEIDLAFLTLFTGDLDEATKLGVETLRRARAPHHGTARRDLWYLFSQLAAAKREHKAAILFGKLAVNALHRQAGGARVETPLQRLFGAGHGDVFRHLAALLIKAGRLPEANIVLAMLKESELFEMLRRDPLQDPRRSQVALSSGEAEWHGKGEGILESFAAAPPGVAERKFASWLASCEHSFGAVAAGDEDAPHVGLSALGARVGLLHLLPGAQALTLLFCTTNFQINLEAPVGAQALRQLVREFREAIEQRADNAAALGAMLHSYLIAPIEDIYRDLGIRTLLIAADGMLRYVPFGALHDGQRWLAETTATLLFTEAVPRAELVRYDAHSLAAFVAPGFASEAARLVRDAAGNGMFAGDVVANVAFDAASLGVGLASHRLIHVAARVVLDGEQAANSVMHMGDGGILALPDLVGPAYYFRDVAMIALTGCETSPGVAGDGGELEALAALLRWRGVDAVLETLWPADGLPASFWTVFYAHRRDGRSTAMALNQAQRAVLSGDEAYRHPYYWAPFVVFGGVE